MSFFSIEDKIGEAISGAASLISEQLDEVSYIFNIGSWYIPFASVLVIVLLYVVLVNIYETNN